ncbi:MAG: lysine 2,3-aminomutase [Draconibacterium sp.]|nr:MAG: lysine 2,3-aminomutase [Draconibacterium sp.]
MKFKAYSLHNFREIPQIDLLNEEQRFEIEVVGQVLPFRTNNYVIDELINWENFSEDPFFLLNFPQKDMLDNASFERVANLLRKKASREQLQNEVKRIRMKLNPNPAMQEMNVPRFKGRQLNGIQHKYRETLLFFPTQGQTCHAYCTFCFRWPQFAMNDFKFAMTESDLLIDYVKAHPKVTDVLFTGGDPAIMRTSVFKAYLDAFVKARIPHLRNIRIGTKSLAYWPYRYTTDKDADDLLRVFQKVKKHGINIALMAHVNHPDGLKTKAVQKAIKRLKSVGVEIRSQSPLLRKINDNADIWAENWTEQVKNGIIPYYMFIARDTGAQDYFSVSLYRAWQIYRNAYNQVSGISRTVKGPSMSCGAGKIQIVGVTEVGGEKVFVLNFLQGRDPDWVGRPFFARFNPNAIWLNDLEPAFGKSKFFFEDDYYQMHA